MDEREITRLRRKAIAQIAEWMKPDAPGLPWMAMLGVADQFMELCILDQIEEEQTDEDS